MAKKKKGIFGDLDLFWIRAIRALPEKYVKEDTVMCQFGDTLFVANGRLPALWFKEFSEKWKKAGDKDTSKALKTIMHR